MASLFVDYLARRLPLVEQALAGSAGAPLTDAPVASDLANYLYAPLGHFTASGGKRVRPVLALLGAEAVGGRAEDALSCAVAVELFQSAALIHDDIADKSELRRGEPCLYRTAGVGLAINAGDLALTRVFEVILDDEKLDDGRKARVLAEVVRMERHTLEGQALDLGWVRDARWNVTPDDYTYMIDSKTAWYTVASPLALGALAAGGSDETVKGLVEVGRPAGLAFQIQDDILDYMRTAHTGKPANNDLREGKITLPLLAVLDKAPAERRTELLGRLACCHDDEESVEYLQRTVENEGGLTFAAEVMRSYVARAVEMLSEYEPSEYRTALVNLCAYIAERDR